VNGNAGLRLRHHANGEVERWPETQDQRRGRRLSTCARGATTDRPRPTTTIFRRRFHCLKEVMSVGAVKLTTEHAAVLEICGRVAGARVVAAELLAEFLVAADDARSAFDARL